MKKYVAEFIGTMTLVILGCGTAMLVGCDYIGSTGYILTAFAFGLTIIAMAYSIGNISGCHINPAVSLGVLMTGGMDVKEFAGYVISQICGAFAGSLILAAIFGLGGITDMTGGFGSNGLGGVNGSVLAGLLVEIVLTFIIVTAILGGIGLTGTSVNPARSIGPAIVAAFNGNTDPIACVWVFIVGPLVGAALSAVVYKALEKQD